MNIDAYKDLNDERGVAKQQLEIMCEMTETFKSKWQDTVGRATNQLYGEFINYFQSHNWGVSYPENSNSTKFTCGIDSFYLEDVNFDGDRMIFRTGENYSDNHYFSIAQKSDDPNFVDTSAFGVDGEMLLTTSKGEPDFDSFLKNFTTLEKVKNVEQKIQDYEQRIQKNMNLMDKVTFYIVPIAPPDKCFYYSKVEDYINSL